MFLDTGPEFTLQPVVEFWPNPAKRSDVSHEDTAARGCLGNEAIFYPAGEVDPITICCQQAAKRMADNWRIINFSTSITAMLLPTYSAYAPSKGAVRQITRILAKQLSPRGITFNAVSPGPTDTELFGQDKTEEEKRRFGQLAALGRLGKPQDIANVVALLSSEDAHWITGQNIRAKGGTI